MHKSGTLQTIATGETSLASLFSLLWLFQLLSLDNFYHLIIFKEKSDFQRKISDSEEKNLIFRKNPIFRKKSDFLKNCRFSEKVQIFLKDYKGGGIHPKRQFLRFAELRRQFEFSAERLSENEKTISLSTQKLTILQCITKTLPEAQRTQGIGSKT